MAEKIVYCADVTWDGPEELTGFRDDNCGVVRERREYPQCRPCGIRHAELDALDTAAMF
jgi:hypothetical protein